ncbi:MAG: uracil-DNA glycosylase family protein [Candidatus Eisenbacteria bacterium]
MASGRDRARKLAAEYFRQLGESGETEIYLSPGYAGAPVAASAVKAPATAAPRTPEVAATPRTSDAAATSPALDAPSAAQSPDVPAPVIISVKFAFSTAATTGDMFSGSSGIEKCATLEEVAARSVGCQNCELAGGRTNVVFGAGNPHARLMFIGEAPGRDEDIQGVPFVGRAGQLLNKILEAAEIERDDVYIANIIKCRPPNNRTPLTNEIEACIPYLGRQVALIAPKIICTLGLPATQTLLGIRGSMGSLRGKMYVEGDVKVIPTYHPAAALRDPKYKRPIWDDFQMIKREYTRT